MQFELSKKEELSSKFVEQLLNFGFKKINIDTRVHLIFIEIEDEDFNSYITKVFFEDKLQHCLHIYKMFEYGKSINIPLSIIESVNEL